MISWWSGVLYDLLAIWPWIEANETHEARVRASMDAEWAICLDYIRGRGRRSLVATLAMVAMLCAAQPVQAQTASIVKDPWVWLQNEAKNQWDKVMALEKANQDTIRHVQSIASYYKTAQIWYHMYDRIANGNLNLMISSLLPTLTFESDHVPGAYEQSQGAVGMVTDTVTIRPIPPDARRQELARKFNVNIQSDFNLGDFFKGNPLEWFDVDSSTQFTLPNGRRVIRQPAEIEQAAKIDAALAYTMGMSRMNILPDNLDVAVKTIGSSLSETQRLKLQAAHDQLQWIAQTEGADSPAYRTAMIDYTRALQQYAQSSGDESLDRLDHQGVANRMGAEAKELMERIASQEQVVMESAARQAALGENLKTIKDNYEKPKNISITDFIDPSKSSGGPQGQFAMSLKEQATLNAVHQELAEINKQAALRAIERDKEKLEEARQGNVAMAEDAAAAQEDQIVQQTVTDLVALVRRAAMDGSLQANFVVANPIPGTPDIQWADFSGNTYNEDIMQQALDALQDGRLNVKGGNIVGTVVYMDPANRQANDRNVATAIAQVQAQGAAQRKQIYQDTYDQLSASIQHVPSRLIMGLQQGWARFWANWRAAGGRVFPSLPA